MTRTWILPALVALSSPSLALADKEQARVHYHEGQKLYNLGKFQEASVEFEKAYDVHPDAVFLFNLGQCHRQIGNTDRALFFFRGFLRNKPETPNRAEVEKMIEDLEQARRGGAPAPTPVPAEAAPRPAPVAPPAPAIEAAPTAPAPEQPASADAPAQTDAAVEVTAPSKAPSNWQKWASLGTVGAGVVGLGLGVMFGLAAKGAEDDVGSAEVFNQGDYDDGKSKAKKATLFLGVGSVLVVGGGVWTYFAWRDSPSEPTAGLDLDFSDGIRVAYGRSF